MRQREWTLLNSCGGTTAGAQVQSMVMWISYLSCHGILTLSWLPTIHLFTFTARMHTSWHGWPSDTLVRKQKKVKIDQPARFLFTLNHSWTHPFACPCKFLIVFWRCSPPEAFQVLTLTVSKRSCWLRKRDHLYLLHTRAWAVHQTGHS